jgi:F-type H+-transporting ATPase subunit alpha
MIFVATSSDDSPGLIYLTPYAAMAIAEYFRDKGRDVLIVFDDLSSHAKAYREISLLAKKFPGRNSYPGDIFYVHSKLLERAGNFRGPKGDVAITCLPVVETAYGDITGYIQTNTMSMTDGHLFFDRTLFVEGRRPAIDPFRSVTRVGRQTQTALRRQIGRTLLTFLQKAARLHSLASFETELGEHVVVELKKEKRILQIFDQTAYDLVPFNLQVLLFGLAWGDFWQGKKESEISLEIQKMVFAYEARADIQKSINFLVEDCNSLEALLARIKSFQFPWADWDKNSPSQPLSPDAKPDSKN